MKVLEDTNEMQQKFNDFMQGFHIIELELAESMNPFTEKKTWKNKSNLSLYFVYFVNKIKFK